MTESLLHQEPFFSPDELQQSILTKIAKVKESDPFAPIVLVVDNPLQGMLLRRQLAESLAKNEVRSLANILVQTPLELVEDLWQKTGNLVEPQPSSSVIEATIYSLMGSNSKDAESLQSMTTSHAIAGASRKLQFVSEENIKLMMDAEITNSTQRRVLELVLKARSVQSSKQPAEMCSELVEMINSCSESQVRSIGQVHLVLESIPNLLGQTLEALARKSNEVFQYRIADLNTKTISDSDATTLVSAPDPWTEASIAVRSIFREIKNFDADKIAILYPDESQYLGQVINEIESAGLAWHGRSGNLAQSSFFARSLEIILECLNDRQDGYSGFDRPKLMRLLQNGNLVVDSIQIDVDKVRKYVRRNDLYADCLGWLEILDTLDAPSEEANEPVAKTHLKLLVQTIEAELQFLSRCENWTQLGERLMISIKRIHEGLYSNLEGSIEERSLQEIQKVLSVELRALDELSFRDSNLTLKIDFGNLLRLVQKRISEKRIRHGNLSTGIFVGSLLDALYLKFDVVYVLGATEGLLPSAVNSDPFLPSHLLEIISEHSLVANSKESQPQLLGKALNNILQSAKVKTILRPRGGMKDKLEDEPSRYLPATLNEKEAKDSDQVVVVNSFPASFMVELNSKSLGPVTKRDIALLQSWANPLLDPVFVSSLSAWNNPKFDEYFGNLEKLAKAAPIWEVNSQIALSSTRIDSFIGCPYNFFASSVLGFNTNDRKDLLDDFSSASFGIFFHQAMERFIKVLAKEGVLPRENQGFKAEVTQVFVDEFLMPNLNRFVLTGRNGWKRSLKIHLDTLLRTLPSFFERESVFLRSDPALGIVDAEVSFGKSAVYKDQENSEKDVEWNLSVADADGDEHRIVGQVDRLDASADGLAVGIMDFKTGSREKQVKKLGIGARGQSKNVYTLQDVIYKRAALARYPHANSVRVNFVFPAEIGDRMFLEAKYADDPKNLLEGVLKKIKDAGKSGHYLPLGTGTLLDHDYCKACSSLADITEIVNRDAKA